MKERKVMRSDHAVEQIGDGLYRIDEFGAVNCYLVVGREKALLIDTGNGFGDLKSAVERITDLPLIVAATHGHTDHMGGKGQFKEIYLHPDDICFFSKLSVTMFARRLFLLVQSRAVKQFVKQKNISKGDFKTEFIPLDDGAVFDLGGKTVRAIHTSGHTLGSVIFIDETANAVITGDNVAPGLWMFLPHTDTIENWLESAKLTLKLARGKSIFYGHGDGRLEEGQIENLIDVGKRLLYERKNGLPLTKVYPRFCDTGFIIYKNHKIRNKHSFVRKKP